MSSLDSLLSNLNIPAVSSIPQILSMLLRVHLLEQLSRQMYTMSTFCLVSLMEK